MPKQHKTVIKNSRIIGYIFNFMLDFLCFSCYYLCEKYIFYFNLCIFY